MVLQAHLKKHIIALGGWLLMYTSGPPPPVWHKTTLFPDFFFATFPYLLCQVNWDKIPSFEEEPLDILILGFFLRHFRAHFETTLGPVFGTVLC